MILQLNNFTDRLFFKIAILLAILSVNTFAQTNFVSMHGFEPRFVRPGGDDGIKDIKADYGAVGDGITDDTQAFLTWAGSGARTLFIPEGTYLISDQIRFGSGMKRVLWIGEKRSTTIIKLKSNSPGFGNPVIKKNFIYCIAPGQQGEQNMQNYLYHLTFEIGEGNPGAVAVNLHTNNSGGMYDVTVRASDPVNGKGNTGIDIVDWGAGPGIIHFVEVSGFETGINVKTDNHWTLEHILVSNCGTGLDINESSSIRDFNSFNCNTGIDCSASMVLTKAKIITSTNSEAAINISNPDVLISDLQTDGYQYSIKTTLENSDGDATASEISQWLGEASQSLWTQDSDKKSTLSLPIEESPVYQYAQTASEWSLCTTDAEVQEAIDQGKTHIYLPRNTALSSTIYLRNNVKHIFFLGQSAPYANSPTYVLEDGNSEAVVIEQDCGGTLNHNSSRTGVLRHVLTDYENTAAASGAKVFMESNCAAWKFTNNVKAWIRDADTEAGGPDAENIFIDNSTVWILGHKTEDYATKIKVTNGGYCELLGGTYRQNWDAEDFTREGMDQVNRLPLFLIDNAHASFAGVHSWGPNIAFDPMIREVRGTETRNLARADGGGVIALYTGYTANAPSASNITVDNLTVTPKATTMALETRLISATVYPLTASNKNITWTSSNASIAAVNMFGMVTGKTPGNAYIFASSEVGGYKDSCLITVDTNIIRVTSVVISPRSSSLIVNGKEQLKASVIPENANDPSVTWSSSHPSIVSVNSNGLITAKGTGEAVIYVTTTDGGFTDSCMVTVNPSPEGLYAYEGFDYAEGAIDGLGGGYGWLTPWEGTGSILSPGLTYADVAANGNKAHFGEDTVTRVIQRTLGGAGQTVWMGFILFEGANGVNITLSLLQDETTQMALLRGPYDQWGLNTSGTGDPDNLPYSNEKTKSHFWLFKMSFGATNTLVTVWQDPSLATEPTSGGATITLPSFTFNKVKFSNSSPTLATPDLDELRFGLSFTDAFTKTSSSIVFVTGLSLSTDSVDIFAGDTYQVFDTIFPSDATYKTIIWQSTDNEVATVSSTGLITGTSAGTATIIATTLEGGFSDSVFVNVKNVDVTGVSISTEAKSLYVGDWFQLTYTIDPFNATNKDVSWSSDDELVATVNQDGMVNAIGPGETTITVTTDEGGFSDGCVITIEEVTTINTVDAESFTVYPNPSGGMISVRYATDKNPVNVIIYNSIGEIVYSRAYTGQQIDLSNQPKGVYIVRLKSESNSIYRKVIIQ